MNKQQYVTTILQQQSLQPSKAVGIGYAPSNIALSKYWGKREPHLNLPLTDSVSISLNELGTETKVSQSSRNVDNIILNSKSVDHDSGFYTRAVEYLDLFRPSNSFKFSINTTSSIPVGAGLASSASGFASIILALNDFFSWNLAFKDLSKLARLGSGSASRSIWHGFVHWQAGKRDDGQDCFAKKLDVVWDDINVGVLMINPDKKKISSTDAMNVTTKTSKLYKLWPDVCKRTNAGIIQAINDHDFKSLGVLSEESASTMHATMLDSTPSINYSVEQSLEAINTIRKMQEDGVQVFYTQDAGPNIKLVFLDSAKNDVMSVFPGIIVVKPFSSNRK